jgi:hypothetical protein
MLKNIHFYLLQGEDGCGGVVLARFARRNPLQQKRLTVKLIPSVAEFPSFDAKKLVGTGVGG